MKKIIIFSLLILSSCASTGNFPTEVRDKPSVAINNVMIPTQDKQNNN